MQLHRRKKKEWKANWTEETTLSEREEEKSLSSSSWKGHFHSLGSLSRKREVDNSLQRPGGCHDKHDPENGRCSASYRKKDSIACPTGRRKTTPSGRELGIQRGGVTFRNPKGLLEEEKKGTRLLFRLEERACPWPTPCKRKSNTKESPKRVKRSAAGKRGGKRITIVVRLATRCKKSNRKTGVDGGGGGVPN